MTLLRTEGVALVDGAETFDGRRRATDCFDWAGALGVGPSRGFNRVVPGTVGTVARPHVRDELQVELQWRLNGHYLTDGSMQPAGARDRVDAHLDGLLGFLDGAAGRQLQLRRFNVAGDSTTVDATFKAHGQIRVLSPTIYELAILLAVPSGLVARPSA